MTPLADLSKQAATFPSVSTCVVASTVSDAHSNTMARNALHRTRSIIARLAFAAVVVIAVGACAGETPHLDQTAKTPHPTSRPSSASNVGWLARQAASDAAALATVRDYWAAYSRVMAQTPSWDQRTAKAELEKVAKGSALDRLMITFLLHKQNSEVIRGTVVSHPTVVEHRGAIIVVRDCVDDQSGIYYLDDGTRGDIDDPYWHPHIFELAPHAKGFRVTDVTAPWTSCPST